MLKVAKFGGSSVRDAVGMKCCARRLTEDTSIQLVILSAIFNSTNELERMAKLAVNSGAWEQALEEFFNRHIELMLNLELPVGQWFSSLKDEAWQLGNLFRTKDDIDAKWMDQFYSLGERLSSSIFSHYVAHRFSKREVKLIDAREIIHTDNCYGAANPDLEKIKKSAGDHLNFTPKVLFITQGFIGKGSDGETTTLGREGSDYSAALLARAVGADELQIWTDVAGIAMVDPRLMPNAPFLKQLDYACAQELARYGAKVLFEHTLEPLMETSIPVFVAATHAPQKGGTWIRSEFFNEGVVGVACCKSDRLEGIIATVVGRYKDDILEQWQDHRLERRTLSSSFALTQAEWPIFIEFIVGVKTLSNT